MTKNHFLDQFANHLRTHVGACFPGEKAFFRGQDLHRDLIPIEWFDLYLYGITGRRFKKEQLDLLQAVIIYTSYPDSRIWNNRVAALGASSRSTFNISMSASLAISEAEIFGRGIDIKAITFLTNTLSSINKDISLETCIKEELKRHRGIAGYGRPLTAKDERIEPILAKANTLGLDNGPHLKLAFEVDQFLSEGRWRLKINYAAICAALAADIGMTPKEYYYYLFSAFQAGMPPCYIEAAKKPAGAIFPTPCKGINYTGKETREWKPSNDR